MQAYSAVNLKSIYVLFWLAIIFSAAVILTSAAIQSSVPALMVLAAVIDLFFLYNFVYSLKAKVYIGAQVIEKVTLLRRLKLKYSEIHSFGAYIQSGNAAIVLDDSEINNRGYWGQKFVYVSTIKNYHPSSIKQRRTIRFHLTKDVYDRVKDKMEYST